MKLKSLIIILLLSVCSIASGQTDCSMLDKIDFNDTTLIGSNQLTTQIMDYISSCQDQTKSRRDQMFDVILAVDDILSRCTNFPMYKFVYQYLIYGFSELGVNELVDYMMRLPYIEMLGLNDNELNEMRGIAETYCRVKIGSKAPDIQTVTIDKTDFKLEEISADYTLILFWSANCPHCRDLIKEISTYLTENQNVAFVNVCVIGNKNTAKRLIRKAKIKGVTICDGDGWESKIVSDYAVDSTPSMFLLDKEKKIVSKPFNVDDFDKIIK